MVFENGTSTYLEHVSTFSISLAYDWLEDPFCVAPFSGTSRPARGPNNDCPVLFDL